MGLVIIVITMIDNRKLIKLILTLSKFKLECGTGRIYRDPFIVVFLNGPYSSTSICYSP